MNNADMPAMPTPTELEGYYADPKTCKIFMPFMGLTKREYFAGLAMQGLLAMGPRCQGAPEDMAAHAAVCADALLAELEKSK